LKFFFPFRGRPTWNGPPGSRRGTGRPAADVERAKKKPPGGNFKENILNAIALPVDIQMQTFPQQEGMQGWLRTSLSPKRFLPHHSNCTRTQTSTNLNT